MKIVITLKPHSTKGPLVEPRDDGSLVVYVREIAVESKANEALIKLLAKHFNVNKTHVVIIRGHTSRHKLVEIN